MILQAPNSQSRWCAVVETNVVCDLEAHILFCLATLAHFSGCSCRLFVYVSIVVVRRFWTLLASREVPDAFLTIQNRKRLGLRFTKAKKPMRLRVQQAWKFIRVRARIRVASTGLNGKVWNPRRIFLREQLRKHSPHPMQNKQIRQIEAAQRRWKVFRNGIFIVNHATLADP